MAAHALGCKRAGFDAFNNCGGRDRAVAGRAGKMLEMRASGFRWLSIVGLGLLSAVWGCDSSSVLRKQAAGVWLEDLDFARSRSGVAVATTGPGRVQRRLELRSDGTFRLVLVGADGEPLDPPVSMSGRWRIGEDELALRWRGSALAAPYEGAVPDTFLQFRLGAPDGEADFLEFRDRTGRRVRFARAG